MHTPILLVLSALVAVSGAPAAQDGWEQSVPDTTLVFIGMRSADEFREDWSESAMGRFLADPDVAPLFEELWAELQEMGDKAADDWELDHEAFIDLITGAVAFAAIDVSGTPAGESAGFPLVLSLLADVGENREEFERLVEEQLERAVENEDILVTTEELDGELVTRLDVIAEEGGGWLQFGFRDSVLVAALGERGMEEAYLEVWDVAAGDAETVLADDEDFADVVGDWEGDGLLLYLQAGALLDVIRDMEGSPLTADTPEAEETLAAMEMMGLFDLGPLAQTTGLGSEGTRSRFGLLWGEGVIPEMLSAMAVNEPTSLMDYVPDGALSAVGVRIDFEAAFDAALGAVVASGEVEMADVVAGLAEMDTQLGFSLRDDLLANLDGQLMMYESEVEPAERMFLSEEDTNLALAVGLADGGAVRTLVDGLVQGSGFRAGLKKDDFQGFDVYRITPGPGVFVNWCITDDLAVVSLAPTLVHDVLRRKASADLPSIGADEDVIRELRRHLHDYAVISYTSPSEGFNAQLEQVRSALLQFFPDPPPMDIPGYEHPPRPEIVQEVLELEPIDQRIIDKYFDVPSLTTIHVDEEGIRAVSTGP